MQRRTLKGVTSGTKPVGPKSTFPITAFGTLASGTRNRENERLARLTPESSYHLRYAHAPSHHLS